MWICLPLYGEDRAPQVYVLDGTLSDAMDEAEERNWFWGVPYAVYCAYGTEPLKLEALVDCECEYIRQPNPLG